MDDLYSKEYTYYINLSDYDYDNRNKHPENKTIFTKIKDNIKKFICITKNNLGNN